MPENGNALVAFQDQGDHYYFVTIKRKKPEIKRPLSIALACENELEQIFLYMTVL